MDYQRIIALGKGKEGSVFFPVTVFGESAKLAGEMLAKGQPRAGAKRPGC